MKHKGPRIRPRPMKKGLTITNLVDDYFPAFNAARLREACHLIKSKILKPNVTVGVSLSGALTPPGYGVSTLAPLITAGFIDYIVSTGANLYHDVHYALDMAIHQGSPFVDDVALKRDNVIRVYDILFDYDVLLNTDRYLYRLLLEDDFKKTMGTAELHYLIGQYVVETQKQLGLKVETLLTAAYRAKVPIYTSSPGDSTIGLNIAALNLFDKSLQIDVSLDVNETTSIVHHAKRKKGGESAVIIFGGGSPKNYILQTEPQLQEILGLSEKGHDYYIQFTDARPDTGGLSGATPSEAVSWGKIDPKKLPQSIVAYVDSAIALPLVGAYALTNCPPRKLKKLYSLRSQMLKNLETEYFKKRKIFVGSKVPTGLPAGRKIPKLKRKKKRT